MDRTSKRIAFLLACVAAGACASAAPPVPSPALPPAMGEMRVQSGVYVIDGVIGSGARVERGRCVYTHYTGYLANGTKFESSREPVDGSAAGPVAFIKGTGRVMQGWESGFEGMNVGGTRRLFIPYRLAYGANGYAPRIPPRTDLVFDVELIAVQDARGGACSPLRR